MGEGVKKQKKRQILNRLFKLLNQYSQILLIQLENVGSNQVQDARYRLRKEGLGEMLVAKNTVFKKGFALRQAQLDSSDPDYELRKPLWNKPVTGLDRLSALCSQKVGLIFTDKPVHEIKPLIESNRRPAAARVGMVAPLDVTIPPGPTGMDPSQISFFHALSIPTKINKGQIEITKDYRVTTAGKKVGNSEAAFLQKLNMKPFSYGLEIKYVFTEGAILGPEVFNMNPQDLLDKFSQYSKSLGALALGFNYPCAVSIPHIITNAFKNLASIALGADIKIKQLEGLSANVSAAAAAPARTEAPKADAKKDAKPAKKEEPKKEEVEEDEAFGSMFD